MKKRKVKNLIITFSDGTVDEFPVDAIMSESLNSRKKAGFANLEEWVEYHITWIVMVHDLPEVKEKNEEELLQEANLLLAQKRANPRYAGTADGKDFFYPDTAKVGTYVDFGLDEFIGESNGHR